MCLLVGPLSLCSIDEQILKLKKKNMFQLFPYQNVDSRKQKKRKRGRSNEITQQRCKPKIKILKIALVCV